eukprot:COSAG05_NODE_5871_length_1069_cov_1.059794_2_plen_76_part_01
MGINRNRVALPKQKPDLREVILSAQDDAFFRENMYRPSYTTTPRHHAPRNENLESTGIPHTMLCGCSEQDLCGSNI